MEKLLLSVYPKQGDMSQVLAAANAALAIARAIRIGRSLFRCPSCGQKLIISGKKSSRRRMRNGI